MNWYLAPAIFVPVPEALKEQRNPKYFPASKGREIRTPGMKVHISKGLVEEVAECLYGSPKPLNYPDWRPLSKSEAAIEFERLFGFEPNNGQLE